MMCGNTAKSIFLKVPASELRLDDDFMKHRPKTEKERDFKKMVEEAIKSGLKDFYRPKYDPSFSEDGTSICYEPGKKPAVGKSYNWWAKTAKEFKPEQGSRLGTKTEYIAFLAVLIKELVASGKSIEWAWNAVCNDSDELGYYWDFKDSKYDFELTGSREVCGWHDLANTDKILAEDEDTGRLWFASGFFSVSSFCSPLANLEYQYYGRENSNFLSCGWLVFDNCPDC